ncbi:hypothetical protein [uncultured Mediterranean phage uvMED]|nr:hypothetical protein [uncultured Mediterranean phage uvMED]
MAYTTINKSTAHFNTKLYTGNGSTGNAQTGVGFQPDMTWLKNRNTTNDHELFDAVRGATKTIYPNRNDAEYTNASGSLTSFDSDGFTVGNGDGANKSGSGIVSWNWKANGQGSSNTDGSINTTYTSANTTAGFSIIKYTGNGTSGATIGHGLGSAPAMIIVKNLSTEHWTVRHKDVTAGWNLYLNLTNTQDDNSTVFTTTAPTSSVFSVGNNARTNASGSTYIAYCFAEKTGYSKFGSYVGNGNADGTFVYTGFKPAFIMAKTSSQAGNWFMWDNKRPNEFNLVDSFLEADGNVVEYTSNANHSIDILSNGFKMRGTGGTNNSGRVNIYMAFGQSLVGSNNVPCTAR